MLHMRERERLVEYLVVLCLLASVSKCQKPRVAIGPKGQTWSNGNTDRDLTCVVMPKGNVKVKWNKNGQDVTADGRIDITGGVRNRKFFSSLMFRNVRKQDEGDYQCIAINQMGSVASRKARLIVYGPPSVNVGHPLPRLISVSWHDELSLQCDGKGPPNVTRVVWSYKAFVKYDTEFKQVLFGEIPRRLRDPVLRTLPREDDAMTLNVVRYEVFCTVSNSEGNQRSGVTVINIKSKPDTPTVDHVEPLDLGKAITLFWKTGSNGHEAMYCSANFTGKNGFSVDLTPANENARNKNFISGFSPMTSYVVRIRCRNSVGYSEWSIAESFITKEGIPTDHPPNVLVVALNSTSVKISWQPIPPNYINGKLIGYKVLWKEMGSSENIKLASPDELEVNLYGLSPGKRYSVAVLGYTSAGNGSRSVMESVTTPLFDAVIPPDIRVSHTSPDKVTFNYVDNNGRKGALPDCSILLNDSIHDTILVKISLMDGSNSRSVNNLIPNTKYSVKIRCISYENEEIYSDTKYFRTLEDKPSYAPSKITLKEANNSVLVTWKPVLDDLNGNLIGYNVCVTAIRANNGKCFLSTKTTHTLTNLQPHSIYTVYVSTCTKAGCGPRAHKIITTTDLVVETTTIESRNAGTSTAKGTVPHAGMAYFNFVYVAIAVLAAGIIILLVALFCRKRAQKRKQQNTNNAGVVTFTAANGESQYEVPLLPSARPGAGETLNQYYTIPAAHSPSLSKETSIKLDDVKFSCDKVTLKEVIGKGEFGRVYKGTFAMPRRQGSSVMTENLEVAVKTMIMHEFDASEYEEFVKEGLRMKDMDHPNVMSLIGICLPSESNSNANNLKHAVNMSGLESISPLVIVPFMSNGDLKHYLYNARICDETNQIGLKRLLQFAYDISCGMEYLTAKNIVHRDLACRNCMLDSKLNVVVSDFGLSRQIYSSSYYVQKRAAKMPVKWMAIESLMDRLYTSMTDVWAFGVTAWELFTYCQNPFPGVENHEMLELLKAGTRLKRPPGCPNDVWNDAVFPCWDPRAEERPTFTELVELFAGFKKFYENEPDPDASGNNMYVNMQPPDDYEKLVVAMPRTNTVSSENNEIPIPYDDALERLPSGKIVPKRDRSSSKKPLLRQSDAGSDNSADVVDL